MGSSVVLQVLKRFYLVLVLLVVSGCQSNPKEGVGEIPSKDREVLSVTGQKLVYENRKDREVNGRIRYVSVLFKPKSQYKSFHGIPTNRYRNLGDKIGFWIGRLEYKDGTVYTGTFNNDKYNGLGRLEASGKVQEGRWVNGKLVEPLELAIGFDFRAWQEKAVMPEKSESFALLSQYKYDKKRKSQKRFKVTLGEFYFGQLENGQPKGWGVILKPDFIGYYPPKFNGRAIVVNSDWQKSGDIDLEIHHAGYEFVRLDGKFVVSKYSSILQVSNCGEWGINGQYYRGHFGKGWRQSENGDLFYYHRKGGSDLLARVMNFNQGLFYSHSQNIKKDKASAMKDKNFCYPEIAERADDYFNKVDERLLKAQAKASRDHKRLRAKLDARAAAKKAKKRAEQARRAKMKTCPVCAGKGFLTSTRQVETRYSPLHEYRNGLKITKKTSITSTQKRYDGLCHRCKGEGLVDP